MKTFLNKHSFVSLLLLILLSAAIALSVVSCEDDSLDKGEKTITVEVTGENGELKTFTVKTDKENVGDALLEADLIEGEDGAYGWYITTIDGEYHKYEEDGKYWAFYIDGEYAMTGVSSTKVTDGATYAFKAE